RRIVAVHREGRERDGLDEVAALHHHGDDRNGGALPLLERRVVDPEHVGARCAQGGYRPQRPEGGKAAPEEPSMPRPTGHGIIDLMMVTPRPDAKPSYEYLRPLLRDRESLESFQFPVEYIFKDVPRGKEPADPVHYTLEQMDRHGVERALVPVDSDDE